MPTGPEYMQAAIDDLDEAIAGYSAALAADSLDPKESYSLDGENCTRNEWRSGIATIIGTLRDARLNLQKDLNARRPYQLGIRQVL